MQTRAELLRNGSFQAPMALPPAVRRARFAVSAEWQVELKALADVSCLRLGPVSAGSVGRGVRIELRGTKAWVRLLQELDAGALPFGRRCRIAIRARSESADDRIAWAAILSQREDGKVVFHTRLFEDMTFPPEGREARRSVTLGPAKDHKQYFFALQFEGDIQGLQIEACSLVDETPPPERVAGRSAAGRGGDPQRLSIGVVAWDMGHNPVGRAFLLADLHRLRHDVELLGPLFSRYGTDVWKPIRDTEIPVHAFRPDTFRAFVQGALQLVKDHPCDVVHVCKARLPSLLIGLLYKLYWGIPVIVDADDCELSFFEETEGLGFEELLAALDPSEWMAPFGKAWTRFSDGMVRIGDALTVCNETLRERYGGQVVGHARDERVFDPERYDRRASRAEFGLREEDRVVLFLGTVRQHKGILETAAALAGFGDPSHVLCVVGTITDKALRQALEQFRGVRIVFHDDQPFARIAEIVNMADLVCLLQNPRHPTTKYQIPAKLTDALAMGVPVIATQVPPLRELVEAGAVAAVDEETFRPVLGRLLADDAARAAQGRRGRAYYLDELSYGVNGVRLEKAVKQARRNPTPVSATDLRLLALLQDHLGKPIEAADFTRLTRSAREPGTFHIRKEQPVHVAFFWKQNDSGIYGRRSDMVCKYLAQDRRIGTIVHFDAAMGLGKLQAQVQMGEDARLNQGHHVVRNTIERFLHLQDEPAVLRHTFLYDDGSGSRFLGQSLPRLSDYPAFVSECLCRAGVHENVIAWVCPINFEYPAVAEELQFPFLVADIIDNHLAWNLKPEYAERVRKNYEDILPKANVAFANCEVVRSQMSGLHGKIRVVPNGAELFPPGTRWPEPARLRGLPRPIVGYVGNLSDRLRLPLLERIAREYPEGSLVLIGSAHGGREALALRRFPNVHALGVIPYEQVPAYIAQFQVAMIPHEANAMTEAMNPLKLYVYASVGVPVVSTAVSNLGDFGRLVRVSADDDAFLMNLRAALAKKPAPRRITARLRAAAWPVRVQAMLDEVFARL